MLCNSDIGCAKARLGCGTQTVKSLGAAPALNGLSIIPPYDETKSSVNAYFFTFIEEGSGGRF